MYKHSQVQYQKFVVFITTKETTMPFNVDKLNKKYTLWNYNTPEEKG